MTAVPPPLGLIERRGPAVLAAAALAVAGYVALRYAGQALLDMYFFRQTQTALTSYWFVKEGYKLAYITPVAGSPWSIPFEFPIYQALVAVIVQLTGAPMDSVGRLLSFAFLLGCLHPAHQIARRLCFAPATVLVFAALLLTSPLYLYWGRTFMIETAATYFAIAALPWLIDIVREGPKPRPVLLFAVFLALGLLQKVTTALPVAAFAGVVWLVHLVATAGWSAPFRPRVIVGAAIALGLPLAVGAAWAVYSDHIKSLNAFGRYLTSDALSAWNWGTLSQRLSAPLYVEVMGARLLGRNAAGALGCLLLLAGLATASRTVRMTVLSGIVLGLGPLLLFTNLHIQHDYYQTSCAIFLIGALAVSIGEGLPRLMSVRGAVVAVTSAIMVVNLDTFVRIYWPMTEVRFTETNHRDMAIGMTLRRIVPEDRGFIAFGNEWNSSFAYIAQRKSFTVVPWFADFDQVWARPELYLDGVTPGAVVACPQSVPRLANDADTSARVKAFLGARPDWRMGEVAGCAVMMPSPDDADVSSALKAVPPAVSCEGSLDMVNDAPASAPHRLKGLASVAGWTAVAGGEGRLPDAVYVTLKKDNDIRAFRAIAIQRPDVADFFGRADVALAGFSSVIDVSKMAPGAYMLGVARNSGGALESCGFSAAVTVEAE